MNATVSNNNKKHIKLCVSILLMLFICCTRSISQSIEAYLPTWVHNNISTNGGESEGNAIAYYGDDIYVTGYFLGSGNLFCNSSFPQNPCSISNCQSNEGDGRASTVYSNYYYRDAFLAKYCKSDGGLQWIRIIRSGGTNGSDAGDVSGIDITIDASGNPIVAGYFESHTLSIDDGVSVTAVTGITNIGATGTRDVFVMEFDRTTGGLDGAISIGSSSREDVYGIVRNSNGIYICGSFGGDLPTVLGSTGSTPLVHTGGKDVYIIRIPNSFAYNSVPCGLSIAGSGDEEAYDIASDNSGNLFVTGYFESDDGDFLNRHHGGRDMFLTEITYSTSVSPCSLAVAVTTVLGGPDDDYGHSVAVDGGGIYVTGAGKGPLTLNNTPTTFNTPFGDVDIFISRYNGGTLSHDWTHFIGGTSVDVPAAVCLDGTGGGGVIVTGHIPGLSAFYTTSSSPLPMAFLSNSTNPNVSLFPGNQTSNQTNSFMIHYTGGGNTATNSIFSSTAGHYINSIILSSTGIYYTGSQQGSFITGSTTNSCNSFTCTSSTTHPAVIISHVQTTPVCPIQLPFIITCTNCSGCPLSVQFNSSQQNVCTGGQVQFQDITNYSNWPSTACTPQWSFQGGTVISTTPLIVQYTSAGSYSVTLTVTCTDGLSLTCPYTGTLSNFITVADCPPPVTYQQGPGPTLTTNSTIPTCTYCPCTNCPPPLIDLSHVTDFVHRDPPCDMCIHSFELTPGKKYLLSAWTKEKNPCTLPMCHAAISLVFPETNSPTLTYLPSGKVIDGWQRIEATFIVPNDATSIQVFLSNISGNSSDDVYFDDIRIHPFDANMKSYVYDPVSLKLVSELDENNYATFYEYDEEGKLSRVKKETERGIATIKESRVNTKKN